MSGAGVGAAWSRPFLSGAGVGAGAGAAQKSGGSATLPKTLSQVKFSHIQGNGRKFRHN